MMNSALERHERIALQFSGGRDSLACLYLLRPHWDRLTVYWCDMGASYPETMVQMQSIRDMVPNFAVIEGQQPDVIKEFGIPSDLVPVSATPFGRMFASTVPLMQDRYSCCTRSKMIPTHQRMLDDGITLIIRGQKQTDKLRPPVRSGESHDGIEYLFPIENWDAKQVMQFLRDEEAPIPRFYEMLESMPDCMDCSAYWEDGASKYLRRYHHAQFLENQKRLDIINKAVGEHIAAFNQEVTI